MAYRKTPTLTWIESNDAIDKINRQNEEEPTDWDVITKKTPTLTWIQCEQAMEEICTQNEEEPVSIQRISAWLWLNRKLYERAKKEWRSYSCTPPFGCNCTAVSGEYRMHHLYELLVEVTELHQKESFFQSMIDWFYLIENDSVEFGNWLDKNFDRALDVADLLGMHFLVDDLDFHKSAYAARSGFYRDNGVYVKSEEFSNALKFLEIYSGAYWKHDLAPF
jgi:hypothetical protein